MPPAMPVRPVVSGGAEAVRRVLEMLCLGAVLEGEGSGGAGSTWTLLPTLDE